jgi:hypothetical protein
MFGSGSLVVPISMMQEELVFVHQYNRNRALKCADLLLHFYVDACLLECTITTARKVHGR